eukprot:614946-Pelagomonas_calceolata.AAC.3
MAWLVVAEVSLYFQIISPSQLRARRILATSPCTWAVWGVRVGDPAGRQVGSDVGGVSKQGDKRGDKNVPSFWVRIRGEDSMLNGVVFSKRTSSEGRFEAFLEERYIEHVRLLGGPSSGVSFCIPGKLALVGASAGGALRASLASVLAFWAEGRTLTCVGAWIECIGEAVLALCLERVRLLGGSLWGSVAPVFIISSYAPMLQYNSNV